MWGLWSGSATDAFALLMFVILAGGWRQSTHDLVLLRFSAMVLKGRDLVALPCTVNDSIHSPRNPAGNPTLPFPKRPRALARNSAHTPE
jgi:hypothetical protein